jgi:hypothetical protein
MWKSILDETHEIILLAAIVGGLSVAAVGLAVAIAAT